MHTHHGHVPQARRRHGALLIATPVRTHRLARAVAVAGTAGALLGLAACGRSAPTAADLPETTPQLVAPHVSSLELVPATTGTGRTLTVGARLSDPHLTLGPGDRVALSVLSGTGDTEAIRAERAICPRAGVEYACREFLVLMRPGHTIAGIVARLPEIGGRVILTAFDGEFASVQITASGDAALDAAMARVRTWPHVRVVELNAIGRVAGGPPPPAAHAEAPLDITTGVRAGRSGDGRLQVIPGGVIQVRYRQPTGEILTASVTLPQG